MNNLCFVSFWRNGSEKGCVINIFVPLNQEIQVILDLTPTKLFVMNHNMHFWKGKKTWQEILDIEEEEETDASTMQVIFW